jgi:hypothetical protein
MKKLVSFVASLFVMMLISTTASADVSKIWSAKTSRDYYYIGGDRISLGVLRFNTNDWRDTDYITRQVRPKNGN